MRFINHIFLAVILLVLIQSCKKNQANKIIVSSPNERISLQFEINNNNRATYLVRFDDKLIIDTSKLGFHFKDQQPIIGNLKIENFEISSFSESWELPWGEQRIVDNTYNQLIINLIETTEPVRKFSLKYKVYNDGLGFRFEFPEQENLNKVIIMDEMTEFNLTGNHKCWWIPGDWDSYEHLYNTTRISEIDAKALGVHNVARSSIMENAVNTPFTMKTDDGVYLSFHEANLTDYAGMTLRVDPTEHKLTSALVPNTSGEKVITKVPFVTPWRTIQIVDRAGDLIESKLILNLNEPNKLGDVSWVKPMKYVGIWWEIHLGITSWDTASGKHGATTENAKKYIDFASENGIGGLLVEGWNTGWERWIGFPDREGVFDFVTPYPDYDLEEVVRYGKEKGVELIMHHETSAAPRTYAQQMDTAYRLMQHLGVSAVKTGYVGPIIPNTEYHHGQWMVNQYRKAIETAAKYHIAVNAHEPIKATGLRRTFPNEISREGLRGQEFNAWADDGGNPPEHLSIVTFTRMLAGPIDFTPGIFHISLNPYKPNNQVNTTLAHQLALYVVIYSPIQMAADLPEHYEGHPAFQFIRDVGVDWEQTKVLDREIGDFVTIARQERETGNWFVGSITDENERNVEIILSFLDDGKEYEAIIYKDGEDAHWKNNPTSYSIDGRNVVKGDTINFKLAPGGGAAISLMQ